MFITPSNVEEGSCIEAEIKTPYKIHSHLRYRDHRVYTEILIQTRLFVTQKMNT